MLTSNYPAKVKFICGLIYREEATYQKTIKFMQSRFGKIDYESPKIDFNFTDYYFKEMDKPLFRRFISFYKLEKIESFVRVKLFCIKLEKKLSINKKRMVNIDPGYINLAKLVLFTTKDFSHRAYLGKGVYAEVTLAYTKSSFSDFEWTYPDYKTATYKNNFLKIRSIYHKQIASSK